MNEIHFENSVKNEIKKTDITSESALLNLTIKLEALDMADYKIVGKITGLKNESSALKVKIEALNDYALNIESVSPKSDEKRLNVWIPVSNDKVELGKNSNILPLKQNQYFSVSEGLVNFVYSYLNFETAAVLTISSNDSDKNEDDYTLTAIELKG